MGRILGAARTGGADCGGVAGGMNPAPTNKFYVLGRPGWLRPCARQTSVGDDACIVPGALWYRKGPGRAMALPYKSFFMPGANRGRAAAGSPANLAAAGTPRF